MDVKFTDFLVSLALYIAHFIIIGPLPGLGGGVLAFIIGYIPFTLFFFVGMTAGRYFKEEILGW